MASDYSAFILSEYTELAILDENVFCIQHNSSKKLYVKKIIDTDKAEAYKKLKQYYHPNISNAIEAFECDEKIHVIQEYVHGETLRAVLQREKTISQKHVLHYSIQICEALLFLHSLPQPIVHRDLKPENIMIVSGDIIKIIDFDISREYKNKSSRDTFIAGTRGYAAPEQFGFAETDQRADIYAVGVILHEMLTGKIPIDCVDYKGNFRAVIKKCLQTDRNKRYSDMQELKKVLISIQRKSSVFYRLLLVLFFAAIILIVTFSPMPHRLQPLPSNQYIAEKEDADAIPQIETSIAIKENVHDESEFDNNTEPPKEEEVLDNLTYDNDTELDEIHSAPIEELDETAAADEQFSPWAQEPQPERTAPQYGDEAIFGAEWVEHSRYNSGLYVIFDNLPSDAVSGNNQDTIQRLIDRYIKIYVNEVLVENFGSETKIERISVYNDRIAVYFAFYPEDIVAFPEGDILVDVLFSSDEFYSKRTLNVTQIRKLWKTGFLDTNNNVIAIETLDRNFDYYDSINFFYVYTVKSSAVRYIHLQKPLVYYDGAKPDSGENYALYYCGLKSAPNFLSQEEFSSLRNEPEDSYVLGIQSKSVPSLKIYVIIENN